MGLSPVYPAAATFSDVPSSSPYYGYIEAAYQAGIIGGTSTPGGTLSFNPGGTITEATVIAVEILALGDEGAAKALSATAVPGAPSWAWGAINEAQAIGLLPAGFSASGLLTSSNETSFLAALQTAGKEGTLTLSASPQDAAVGQEVTLSATGTLLPITYASTSKDVVISGDTFSASAPGNYTVTGTTSLGLTGTVTVSVYGDPASLQVNAPHSVVANGVSTQTFTVSVLDANGNVVASNGDLIQVESSNPSVASLQTLYNLNPPTYDAQPAVDGVATFTLVSGILPGSSATLTATDLQTVSLPAATGTVLTDLQTATSVSVTPENAYLPANDTTGNDTLDVTVLDQTGNPMLQGTYGLTASLTGPATFPDGTTGPETLAFAGNLQPGSPSPATLTLDDIQSKTGTVTVTVAYSAPGTNTLTPGTATVLAVVDGAPVAFKLVPPSSASFAESSSAGLTYTLEAVDQNGTPVPYTGDVYLTCQTSAGQPAQNLDINGTPCVISAQVDGGNGGIGGFDQNGWVRVTMSGSPLPVVITEGGGQRPSHPPKHAGRRYGSPPPTVTETFIHSGLGYSNAGTYQIQAWDPMGSLTSSSWETFTETADAPIALSFLEAPVVLTPSHPTTTVSVQLVDDYGNPVAMAGVPVTFTASGGSPSDITLSSPSALTNSQGQASTTATIVPIPGVSYDVTATGSVDELGDINFDWNPYDQNTSLNISTSFAPTTSLQVALQDQNLSSAFDGSPSQAIAGDNVVLTVKPLDAYGNVNTVANESYAVKFSGPGSLDLNGFGWNNNCFVSNFQPADGSWVMLSVGSITGCASADSLYAATEGQVTVTVTDLSAPGTPSATASITVFPDNANPSGWALYNSDGTVLREHTNGDGYLTTPGIAPLPEPWPGFTVKANTPEEFTLKLVDNFGNPVIPLTPLSGLQSAFGIVNLSSGFNADPSLYPGVAGAFRSTAKGADLPLGDLHWPYALPSMTFWYVDPSPGTYMLEQYFNGS